jgi:hypothetical protein
MNATFVVALGELVQFGRGHSNFIMASERGLQNFDQGFHILQQNVVHLDAWLNLISGVALQVMLNIA